MRESFSWRSKPNGKPAILLDLWDAVDRGNIPKVVDLYHDAIFRYGIDTVVSMLPARILDRIDTAEYELQRSH